MKKNIVLILLVFFSSCNIETEITIHKVQGSPEYSNAKINLNEPVAHEDGYEFSFDVASYELGMQTLKNFDYQLANSTKGQHIHFIVNNDPYSAHYEDTFTKQFEESSNVILAFLSRSYHESVKNPNSFVLTQVGEDKIDLNKEFLFYSRPKGTYEGLDTEYLLLDFYLVNTEISSNGNKVKATIMNTEFIIDEWAPYYIKGLSKGEIKIKLELIDAFGNLIDTPFNPSERTVILK